MNEATRAESEKMAETLQSRGYFVTKNPNHYDRRDMVQMHGKIMAGAVKIAAYKVRDPETLEWSVMQFHMTYNNMVMGMLEEQGAKLFANFITSTLDGTGPLAGNIPAKS
jgi:hypothetical protein